MVRFYGMGRPEQAAWHWSQRKNIVSQGAPLPCLACTINIPALFPSLPTLDASHTLMRTDHAVFSF